MYLRLGHFIVPFFIASKQGSRKAPVLDIDFFFALPLMYRDNRSKTLFYGALDFVMALYKLEMWPFSA